jgi:hypothetical protein
MCANSTQVAAFMRDIPVKFFTYFISDERSSGNRWAMTCRDDLTRVNVLSCFEQINSLAHLLGIHHH